jgi:hypothetical protein
MESTISDKILIVHSEVATNVILYSKNGDIKYNKQLKHDAKEELQLFLNDLLPLAVSKKVFLVDTPFFSLVPSLLEENEARNIAALCFVDNKNLQAINSDMEFNTVVSDKSEIIGTIKRQSQNIQIKDIISIWCNECIYSSKSGIYLGLWIRDDWMYVVVIKDNQVLLCNSYPINNISDVMYFSLLQIEEFSLDMSQLQIEVFHSEKMKDYKEFLNPYFENLSFREYSLLHLDHETLDMPQWLIDAVL